MKTMNLREQQSLQMLRQQNLLLLEQLRKGQTAMKNLMAGGVSQTTSPGHSRTRHYPGSPVQKMPTPKKNVSFSEKDFHSKAPTDGLNASFSSNSVRNGDASLSGSPRQTLIQGQLDDSYNGHEGHSSLVTATMTSTPNRSTTGMNDTPRSILKRRKIIDDNVRVESKFAHTPTNGRSPKNKRGLNYSYTDYDDLDCAMGRMHFDKDNENLMSSTAKGKNSYSDATDGSYIEEYLDTSVGDLEQDLKEIQSRKKSESRAGSQKPRRKEAKAEEVEALLKERLMKDSGNDKKNAHIVRDLRRRAKSDVFESQSEPHVVIHKSPRNPSARKKQSPKATSKTWADKSGTPLLGYDWIAGVLENDSVVMNQQDDYFSELEDFRRVNKNDCISETYSHSFLDLTKPIEPVVENPAHTCIHGYGISDRLFTEPMKLDGEGSSICPICLVPRKVPTAHSPGFVRVSIPRSTLESPYKIKPHRRRSFDPTDTCALANHCLAGWESSKPSQIPAASSVDITQASDNTRMKYSQSLSDAEKEAMSYSRQSRLAGRQDTLQNNSTLQSNSTSFLNSSKMAPFSTSGHARSGFTDQLLNTSHELRFHLQKLEHERGLAAKNPPHSTNYPML